MASRLKKMQQPPACTRGTEVYGIGTVNFSSQIEAGEGIAGRSVDCIRPGARCGRMVKSFRKQGYAPQCSSHRARPTPQFIRLLGQDAEHALGILGGTADSAAREKPAFRRNLRAQVVGGADAARRAGISQREGARGGCAPCRVARAGPDP
jgi:hypothetical protein